MAWQNRFIFFVSVGAVVIALAYLAAGPMLASYDQRPGAPVGQWLGVAAAIAMLLTFLYLPVRRSAALESGKPRYQFIHTLVGILGLALALAHSRGRLTHPPAFVLLAAIGLMVTGVYGRVVSPKRLGAAFGRAALPYSAIRGGSGRPDAIDALVEMKRAVLARLDPPASEARFVLRTHHWLRRPLLACRYFRLASRERRLIESLPAAAVGEVSLAERLWRRVHVWLAWLFVVGLLGHVVTTLFFAGYVADGREIYWWHLRK